MPKNKITHVRLNKLLDHLFSWKFHLLVLSTYLFIRGTLSENGWLIMATATTGLREMVNLVTLKLGALQQVATAASPTTVDNPDAK